MVLTRGEATHFATLAAASLMATNGAKEILEPDVQQTEETVPDVPDAGSLTTVEQFQQLIWMQKSFERTLVPLTS